MSGSPGTVDELFPQSEYEHPDKSDPYVKCSVKKMAKGYQWEARIHLRMTDPPRSQDEEGTVDRALTLLINAEKRLKEQFGSQS